jgi:hypothetical protein
MIFQLYRVDDERLSRIRECRPADSMMDGVHFSAICPAN